MAISDKLSSNVNNLIRFRCNKKCLWKFRGPKSIEASSR